MPADEIIYMPGTVGMRLLFNCNSHIGGDLKGINVNDSVSLEDRNGSDTLAKK